MENNQYIYMDHAATTSVHPEVLEVMQPYFSEYYGNPSGLYSMAQEARRSIDQSRKIVSNFLGCRPSEVIFTSGGTESDNLAIKGSVFGNTFNGKHILTTSIEHHAVLNSCYQLEQMGFEVEYVNPDSDGLINPQDISDRINEKTVLVTVMLVNNEIGTIQPISKISEIIKQKSNEYGHDVIFHTDAVQAIEFEEVDVKKLGVDLLSISAHKFGGPKGVGVLYVRRNIPFEALQVGGGQERERRSGTENVPGIVGLAKAISLLDYRKQSSKKHCRFLRDRLIQGISNKIPDTILNGHPTIRVDNNVNFCFEGIEGEPLLVGLDFSGIFASSGSACSSGSLEPSHVLTSIGRSPQLAQSSLRLTIGHNNTEKEVDFVLDKLVQLVSKLRSMPTL